MTYKNVKTNQSKIPDTVMCLPEPTITVNGTGNADMRKTFHDFRASLNIIIGYSELMLDGVLGKMNDEQREGIKDILSSSFHMLDLLQEISGRQPSERS